MADATRARYDRLASTSARHTREQALAERAAGPAAFVKAFHNHVKKQLIVAFTHQAATLLDLCCGRGGDIQKWAAARLRYVKAIDFSSAELSEARARYAGLAGVRMMPRVDFVLNNDLGRCVLVDASAPVGAGYDVVTCMFALHYFFRSPEVLRTFLTNVAVNLVPGGYFVGIVPDGQRVRDLVGAAAGGRTFESELLRVSVSAPGGPGGFGAGCVFMIRDTATEVDGDGSTEFLVDEDVLVATAAEFGLRPVAQYPEPAAGRGGGSQAGGFRWDGVLDGCGGHVFRGLQGAAWYAAQAPGHNTAELCRVSDLFCTFAFVKDEPPW